MISKTHVSAQKPGGRQLNTKVCSSESAIFVILSSLRPLCSNNDNSKKVQVSFYHKTDAYHTTELYDHSVSS